MINRLIEPTSGSLVVLGKPAQEWDPVELRRQIGYVIQGAALFPHWTVEQNIRLVPQLLGWEKHRIDERVTELLHLMDLEPETYRSRYPSELSGGQQQRVGIARALAADPALILLDEPFSALDPITRQQLQQEMVRLKQTLGKTQVFVTHDMGEAFLLGDLILLLDQGKVQQVGTPDELRKRPANAFVESFMGGLNV